MLIPAGKWPLLEHYFLLYTRHYLRRSFHAVHLLGERPQWEDDGHTPLLVCVNHSSWWDVLLGLLVETELFGWEWYTVMDARQLERYTFFTRLGVIGVDRTSLSGAKEFLNYSQNLLKGKRRSLWLTPQGAMLSNYARPMTFQPGLGYLAAGLEDFYYTRVAFHYEFWNERLPEAFVSVAPIERISTTAPGFNRKRFLHAQERALEIQVDALLQAVQQRDPALFHSLLRGKTGISPTYDTIRRVGAKLRGESFTAEHSEIETPQWKKK